MALFWRPDVDKINHIYKKLISHAAKLNQMADPGVLPPSGKENVIVTFISAIF